MLTRRSFMILTSALAATAAVTGFAAPAFAQAPEPATAFVQSTGQRLVDVVNGAGTLADKRGRMRQIIEGTVDVNGVARFCLGTFWNRATPEQQQQYTALFHNVLLNNITGNLGEYAGVTFEMGRTQQRGDVDVVSTVVNRPNNPPAKVDWWIIPAPSGPKIVDVVAEGTSLRLTQRSDYASYITRNGNSVQALIDAMKQQAAQNG